MYEVRLNGTPIVEPHGLVDLVLSRVRSTVYGGFVAGEYAYIENIGGLTFADSQSREIIAGERELNSKILVEIYYCEGLIFSGKLDISSMSVTDCCYFNAELNSGQDGDAFRSRKNITYSLQPTFKIRLPKKEYLTGGTYVLGDNTTYSSQTVSGRPLSIGVPLKPDGKVTGQVESSTTQESPAADRPIVNININDIPGLADALGGKENAFQKGNLVKGPGINITGNLTGRLVGPGDIEISADTESLKNYVHKQTSPSDTWVVNHNLGSIPTVDTVDFDGGVFMAEVSHNIVSDLCNTTVILFNAPKTGYAIFSI